MSTAELRLIIEGHTEPAPAPAPTPAATVRANYRHAAQARFDAIGLPRGLWAA